MPGKRTKKPQEAKDDSILEAILCRYDENDFLRADGLDGAVIGLDPNSMRLIYSERKVIAILVDQGMDWYEATEHFAFNIRDAWVGDQTPIWCEDDF